MKSHMRDKNKYIPHPLLKEHAHAGDHYHIRSLFHHMILISHHRFSQNHQFSGICTLEVGEYLHQKLLPALECKAIFSLNTKANLSNLLFIHGMYMTISLCRWKYPHHQVELHQLMAYNKDRDNQSNMHWLVLWVADVNLLAFIYLASL